MTVIAAILAAALAAAAAVVITRTASALRGAACPVPPEPIDDAVAMVKSWEPATLHLRATPDVGWCGDGLDEALRRITEGGRG